jgi:phosphoribosylformylglycinamidine synthase
MAARAPLIPAIRAHAGSGGLLLGICNGFQVLTETRLLPGALLRNSGLNFLCRHVCLRVERTDTPFTGRFRKGQVVRFPIAHHEGLYWLPEAELDALERAGRVVFRYASSDGQAGPEAAPNGSLRGIAGILNERGNVLGLMPHPERVCHDLLGGTDGIGFFRSIGDWLEGRAPRGAEGGDIR